MHGLGQTSPLMLSGTDTVATSEKLFDFKIVPSGFTVRHCTPPASIRRCILWDWDTIPPRVIIMRLSILGVNKKYLVIFKKGLRGRRGW